MISNDLDVEYDYRKDCPGKDPDAASQKLYETHKTLWNKELPNGAYFNLRILNPNSSRILLANDACDNLSSDGICATFLGRRNMEFDFWFTENENEDFTSKGRTIGAHIIFPAHRRNGHTINQARGCHVKIRDRFDLTLECISRFFEGRDSPLTKTLDKYKDFIELFVNFKSYIKFFMLQDFVDEKYQIKYTIPFDNFKRTSFPLNKDEYINHRIETINMINKRNQRILQEFKQLNIQ